MKPKSKSAIVAICAIVYFISYFSRKDFAAVMAGMISENIIDKENGGLVGMGLFVCYGIGQLISGFLGDKVKPGIMIISGLSATMICNLIMPFVSDSLVLMIMVWSINGLAQAMLWPPIVRILADSLRGEAFVRANMIVTNAAHVSTVLLYVYVPLCLTAFDWRTVFFTASAMSALAIVVFSVSMHLILRDEDLKTNKPDIPTPVSQKVSKNSDGYLSIILKSGLLPLCLAIITMGFLRDGIESWLPTLYGEAFGRDASESILFSAILPIFSIISIVVITQLHKTALFKNESLGALILFASAVAASTALAFLIESKGVLARIVCLILSSVITAFMHAVNFLLISCLPGRFSHMGRAATTSGICNACTYVGAAVSMYGISAIAESRGWTVTVISWIAVASLGAILSLIAVRSYTRFINKGSVE